MLELLVWLDTAAPLEVLLLEPQPLRTADAIAEIPAAHCNLRQGCLIIELTSWLVLGMPPTGCPSVPQARADWRPCLQSAAMAAIERPGKIICVGKNYLDHVKEMGGDAAPTTPVLFMKPPSAVIGHGDEIVLPPESAQVDYEGELVAIIGERLRHATPEQALRGVRGYTCGNDVTARDLQRSDGQWTRAKGFDTFASLGPGLATGLDPGDLAIATRVNGEERQASRTSMLIHPVGALLAFITSVMTLEPGDAVYTGTPAGVGALRPGDVVEVEIEGVGLLRNTVRAAG